MSIRSKVTGGFLAILVLFAGASIFTSYRFRESNKHLVLVNELILPLSRITTDLQARVGALAEDMRRFYFAEGQSGRGDLSRMARDVYPYLIRKRFTAAERLLEHQKQTNPTAAVDELTGLLSAVRVQFEGLIQATQAPQFQKAHAELRSRLRMLFKRLDEEAQRITLAAQAEGRDTLLASLCLSALLSLLGVLTLIFSHRVLLPLPSLLESIKKIADGDFNQSLKLEANSRDEVALLAREYNRMLEALSARDAKIREQQAGLLQSERLAAVGQLSAEIVHEIRNPLNSISLNIDWLEAELARSSPEIVKTLKSVSREIQRLYQITESYLVRARVPSAPGERTEVNGVLRDLIDFSREEDRRRNIRIEASLAAEEIFIGADRARAEQMFLNLLKNAREAMPHGGTISIRTKLAGNTYEIEFSDTGHGMNETTKRRVFYPFYTTKPNGTGLGLMLTKTIAEEANGTVSCRSQLGNGTTFTLQFPA